MSTTQQNPLVVYTKGAAPLSEKGVATWTMMGQGKIVMDAAVSAGKLVLENLLGDLKVTDLPTTTAKIADYKKEWAKLQQDRMQYTGIIDILKNKCMEVEKEYDPKDNERFKAAVKRELELRKFEQVKAKRSQLLNEDKVKFTTHTKNQYIILSDKYVAAVKKLVHETYITALTAKLPVTSIPQVIEAAILSIMEIKPEKAEKFVRLQKTDENGQPLFEKVGDEQKPIFWLSDSECMAIVQSIPKPDYGKMRAEQIEELKKKFTLYENDLAAGEAVIVQTETNFAADKAVQAGKAASAVSANVLMGHVETIAIPTPGFKPVTEVTKIKVEKDNPQWVAAIITAFVQHFNDAFMKVKVKDYSLLNVKQMAAALDEAGVKVESEYISYESVAK